MQAGRMNKHPLTAKLERFISGKDTFARKTVAQKFPMVYNLRLITAKTSRKRT